MVTLTLTEEQVVDLVKQLPLERKQALLVTLAEAAHAQRAERMEYAQAQLRRIVAERGLDWDTMSEEEREAFIDDLVHEDRPCSQ